MAAAFLLAPDSVLSEPETFAFEHMMSHRTYFGAMWPLTRFSVLPYLLDPTFNTDIPASGWHLNHQQAHNDSLSALPSQYLSELTGINIGQVLSDSNLSDEESRSWWTFVNHQEHYSQNLSLLPVAPDQLYVYPFW